MSPAEYIVKIEILEDEKKEEFSYQISGTTKSLPEVELKDEAHFLIIENHAPIIYVVKSDAQALFELKNDNLKILEVAPKN